MIKKEQEKREKKKINKVQKFKEYNNLQIKKRVSSKLSDFSEDDSDDV